MDATRLKKIEEIYHAALGIAPAGRDAFFKVRCGEDLDLRREVESLLSCEVDSGNFLDAPPQALAAEIFSEHEKRTNLTGRKISHYKIRKLLGKGGMGEVYLAEDTKLDRKAALKILPPTLAADKERMIRFVREAKFASSLNHPNILTIYEINEFEDIHFIATEFVDGKTLNHFVKSDTLDFKTALEIAIQIASALDEAHSAGIIHRDIKPDNVMVRPNGLVKILDFGIAKLSTPLELAGAFNVDIEAATRQKAQTASGTIIGTANYMSPEQAKGKEVDARTDIFSFGVVLYEMISGDLPFEGETAMETIGAILHKEPKPLNSDVPFEIEKIIDKCLRKEAGERYQTIKDVCNDLEDAKRELYFQKLERTDASDIAEPKTQILQATTADEFNQTTTNQTVSNKLRAKYLLIGLLSLIVLIGGFFAYRSLTATKHIESIAVMPFTNESSNADTEYLSDGMTETLIKSLSNLPNLNVKPRSSVFRYKGKETDLQTIAGELNVQAILNGHVVQSGDELTLSLELIDAQRDSVIWTEQYNRKTSELVSLQSDIARDVSSELETKLSGADVQNVTKSYTNNNEAYQLYLKGRFYWNKRGDAELKKGIEYFRQAVEVDPNFALAWSGLADSYALLPLFSEKSTVGTKAVIKMATEKALEIDPQLAEAHNSRAIFLAIYEWDFVEAEAEFRQAIKLNPNYATAHQWLSITLSWRLRHDEAVKEMQLALKTEPLSRIINNDLGYTFLYQKQNDKAIEQFKKTLELHPDFVHGHHSLALALAKAGEYKEAIAEQNKAIALSGRLPGFLTQLSYINAVSGNKAEAHRILGELLERNEKEPVGNYNLAIVYAGLDFKDKAFEYLTKLEQDRFPRMLALKSSPYFENLRDDLRFKQLLKRLNLPE